MRQFFPEDFNRYIEPFAGSAAFFFRVGAGQAILNDLNPHLVDFYRHVSNDPSTIYDDLIAHDRSRETYNLLRARFNSMPGGAKKAAIFYYLNRNSFNGIYRENKSGKYNVPFSASRVPRYPTRVEFMLSAELLKSARVKNLDFEVFCERYCREGDFVYLDPPFYSTASRIFNEYNATPFNGADLTRLVAVLDRLDNIGSKVMISYNESIVNRLKRRRRWSEAQIRVIRTIAGGASGGVYSSEAVLFNYVS